MNCCTRHRAVAQIAAVVVALAFTCSTPGSASAALAQLTGGSGYSGKLSSNPSIRHQQLVCDPTDAFSGSTSVRYDPKTVSLSPGSVFSVTPFVPTNGYVGVTFLNSSEQIVTGAESLNDFFDNQPGLVQETGFVQVSWGPGSGFTFFGNNPSPPTGFNPIAQAGVAGENTHGLEFAYFPGIPDTAIATYTVYGDPGGMPIYALNNGALIPTGQTTPADVLMGQNADQSIFTAAGPYSPATVSGSLLSPEPSGIALLGLASLALLARQRGR